GAAPSVSRLQDDSVVENYNLTLECSVQGTPLPQVLWYKNDTLITSSSRNIRVRTRPRNLRRRKVKRPRSSTLRRRRNSSAVSRSSPWVVGRPVGGPRRRQIRRRLGEPEAPGRGSHSVATAAAEEVAGRRGKLLARRARRQGPASREPRRRPSPEIEPRHPGRRRRPNDSSSDSIASGTSSSNNKGNKRARRPEVKEKKVLVSQLTMRSATEGDAGVYKCVAKSVAGEASAQAMIRVVPHVLKGLRASDARRKKFIQLSLAAGTMTWLFFPQCTTGAPLVVTDPESACSRAGRYCKSQLSRAVKKHTTLTRSKMSTKSASRSLGAVATNLSSQEQGVSLDKGATSQLVTHPHRTRLLAPLYASCPTIYNSSSSQREPQYSPNTQWTHPHCQWPSTEPFLRTPSLAPYNQGSGSFGFSSCQPRPFPSYQAQRTLGTPLFNLNSSSHTSSHSNARNPPSVNHSKQPYNEKSRT
ncbi:hypothetical protein OTU49_017077, partial [Cherax quadricarinatus]